MSVENKACRSITCTGNPSPHRAPWLFDPQDHQLVHLVNDFSAARASNKPLSQPDPALHPSGIIELTSEPGLRMARAVIILLESLEAGGPQERLHALRRLHDEVLYAVHSPLQKNTARVLIQLMKDLVRSCPHAQMQLPLAHEFHQAVRGTPRIIRKLLCRYHLLEMPEAWNQQAFDHHVHDANTKGRKNPTHLVMDAWVKGIRFLTVIYYNTVDPEAASELLRAARIMGISVRIGIEFRACLREKMVEFTWVPLNTDSPKAFIDLLHRPDIAAILAAYAPVNTWTQQHVLHLLRAWNQKHVQVLAGQLGVDVPSPIQEDAFLAYVGQRQPSSLHLAEYIFSQWISHIRQASADLRKKMNKQNGAEYAATLGAVTRLEALVPDTIRTVWLGPEANADLVFPHKPHRDLPEILLRKPEALLESLTPLHPCQMVLNLAGLTSQDVLELLWRGKGRITHLELFNLREWTSGQLDHAAPINKLQRAINEGSILRLKQVVRHIVREGREDPDRQPVFQAILSHLPRLQEYYSTLRLGSRIGTDSTSRSHHTHGMGLVFIETLPQQARNAMRREDKEQRLTLPVHTDIYSFEQHHEPQYPQPWWIRMLRRLPGLGKLGCHSVSGWGLEKKTTTVGQDGNLVTLGGVDARGINTENTPINCKTAAEISPWNPAYINSDVINTLKIIAGFLPAQWAFWYVGSWWVLTWFGALLWFVITAVRNVAQSMVGGGAFSRSMLLPWNRYVSWSRMADSLLYTGISVPLLEVVVRLWLLENLLGITVQDNAVMVYTVIALVNSVYISGHNIFRGLPKEAVIGNLFRSALSIPLSMLLGQALLQCFILMHLPDPMVLLQNCAAIVSKCSSDVVAAVIEGFADRNHYLRMRQSDYDSKFAQIFKNLAKQELLFPHRNLTKMLQSPHEFWSQLGKKDALVARQALEHMLDMMYMWYFKPRARQAFWQRINAIPAEEKQGILALHSLLRLEHEITTQLLQGLLGKDFSRALTFYLQKHHEYLQELKK
ncbi:hypothetical protein [Desulfovibrio intestinalis]|uniref:Uncharacterized protein n=1 Tax=Desulfovibrio intestinalis TaxID=58621 RepID=A0A7W8BYS2_9BACT|nr:hypothetical protein [Desulfovibrio intestinalis]MBB5142435.1 hypothetical protein [Desulfovibrio intestinalis]